MYEAAKLFFVEKVSSVWDTTTKALCWIKEGGAGGVRNSPLNSARHVNSESLTAPLT